MIGGVPATDIAVESAASITAKTGSHPTGASDVTVTVAGRNGTLPGAFTYDTDTAPVITSVTAQGTRTNEPRNFADLDEEVSVTAVVQDPEPPRSPDLRVDRRRRIIQWHARPSPGTRRLTYRPPKSIV
jgi:hypothetical protein